MFRTARTLTHPGPWGLSLPALLRRVPALLLLAALLTATLAACGGAGTDEPLSVDEYMEVCRQIGQDDIEGDETYGTLKTFLDTTLETLSVTAPAELTEWHDASVTQVQAFLDLVEDEPDDKELGAAELLDILTELEEENAAAREAQDALPEGLRDQLLENGCATE